MPTQVKAGDRVLLPGWGGNSIKVGDEVRTQRIIYLFCDRRLIVVCPGIFLVQGLRNPGQDSRVDSLHYILLRGPLRKRGELEA